MSKTTKAKATAGGGSAPHDRVKGFLSRLEKCTDAIETVRATVVGDNFTPAAQHEMMRVLKRLRADVTQASFEFDKLPLPADPSAVGSAADSENGASAGAKG